MIYFSTLVATMIGKVISFKRYLRIDFTDLLCLSIFKNIIICLIFGFILVYACICLHFLEICLKWVTLTRMKFCHLQDLTTGAAGRDVPINLISHVLVMSAPIETIQIVTATDDSLMMNYIL